MSRKPDSSISSSNSKSYGPSHWTLRLSMGTKRKPSAPPPPARAHPQSSSSDSDSSSDEEQLAPAPRPSRPETSNRTGTADSESESESESDSEPKSTPQQQTRSVKVPPKPSESEDSSEEEEEENVKSAVKNPKSQPDKKKSKAAASGQSSSKKNSTGNQPKWALKDQLVLHRALSEYHAKNDRLPSRKDCKSFLSGISGSISITVTEDQLFDKICEHRPNFNVRIWTPEDELALLRALSEYRIKNGKLPPRKDYKTFLAGIGGSFSFPATENQLFSKIRHIRQLYNQRKKKGPDVTFSRPHDKAKYNLCKVLFEDSNKRAKEKTALKPSGGSGTESHKRKQKGKSKRSVSERLANGGVASEHDKACSHLYLHGLVKDLMHAEQCLGSISTTEDAITLIGDSRVQHLEAKTKKLRIDTIKLCMREEMLRTELFDIIADVITDD